MSKINKAAQIIGYGVLAAGAGVLIGNSIYNKISYQIADIEFDVNQLVSGRLGVILFFEIENNNNVGGTVQRVTGKVHYGNLKVADVDTPFSTVIPAKSKVIMPLRISIEAAQFINDVIQLFTNLGGNLGTLVNPLTFQGVLYTNIVNIPLKFNIPIATGL